MLLQIFCDKYFCPFLKEYNKCLKFQYSRDTLVYMLLMASQYFNQLG